MYTRYKINVKFSLSSGVTPLSKLNLTSGTHFVDLAVKMYQLYSLNMALRGPKHIRGTEY